MEHTFYYQFIEANQFRSITDLIGRPFGDEPHSHDESWKMYTDNGDNIFLSVGFDDNGYIHISLAQCAHGTDVTYEWDNETNEIEINDWCHATENPGDPELATFLETLIKYMEV
jgi:hypothetical protein